MKVKLTKLKSQHNRLRTHTVIGAASWTPVVGERYCIYAKGVEFGLRCVETSIVTKVEELSENVLLFDTEFSNYKLEVLE